MKYFTKDWCFSKLTDQEIDQNLKSYRNYIQGIYKKLPFALKILVRSLNLHDGKLEFVCFNREKRELIIRGVFGDLDLGYFSLEIKYIKTNKLNSRLLDSIFNNKEQEILSDEIELLTEKLFSHRILFSTQQDINIKFEDIELKIQNLNPRYYKKLSCHFELI